MYILKRVVQLYITDLFIKINIYKLIISLLLILTGKLCFSQDWNVYFNIGGYDETQSVIETYDKGIVFPVFHASHGDYFEIRKLDNNGNLLWNKRYRYQNGNIFLFVRINKLEKGGYLISGMTTAVDADGDPFIIKLNECFEPEWQLIYNTEDYNFLNSVIEVPNSGSLLLDIKYINSNYTTLVKVNSTGESVSFKKTITIENGKSYLLNNTITFFGEIALGTKNNPNLKWDRAINFKLDTTGNIYWSKISKLSDTVHTSYYSSFVKASQNTFLVGYNNRRPNKLDNRITESFYLRKIDTSGFAHWNKLLGDTTKSEVATSMIRLSDNQYAVYCPYYPVPAIRDQFYGRMYVIDSSGNVVRKEFVDLRTVNGNTTGFSRVTDMITTSDDKILTVGTTLNSNDFDVYCKKYNHDLSLVQKGNTILTYDSLCTKPFKDSTYILPTPKVIYLVKDSFPLDTLIYTEGKVLSVQPIKLIPKINCIIYPNPTDNGVLVSIKNIEDFNAKLGYTLTNQLGQVVTKDEINKSDTFVNLIGKASGVYYLTINNGNSTIISSYKIVKE